MVDTRACLSVRACVHATLAPTMMQGYACIYIDTLFERPLWFVEAQAPYALAHGSLTSNLFREWPAVIYLYWTTTRGRPLSRGKVLASTWKSYRSGLGNEPSGEFLKFRSGLDVGPERKTRPDRHVRELGGVKARVHSGYSWIRKKNSVVEWGTKVWASTVGHWLALVIAWLANWN